MRYLVKLFSILSFLIFAFCSVAGDPAATDTTDTTTATTTKTIWVPTANTITDGFGSLQYSWSDEFDTDGFHSIGRDYDSGGTLVGYFETTWDKTNLTRTKKNYQVNTGVVDLNTVIACRVIDFDSMDMVTLKTTYDPTCTTTQGTVTTTTDASGRVITYTGSGIHTVGHSITWNSDDTIATVTDTDSTSPTLGQTATYSYDTNGRLTSIANFYLWFDGTESPDVTIDARDTNGNATQVTFTYTIGGYSEVHNLTYTSMDIPETSQPVILTPDDFDYYN